MRGPIILAGAAAFNAAAYGAAIAGGGAPLEHSPCLGRPWGGERRIDEPRKPSPREPREPREPKGPRGRSRELTERGS